MHIGVILFGVVFFVATVWLLPSQIMLATANRRFRHLTFHEFIIAAPFPYFATRRLVIAGVGAAGPVLLVALFGQEAAALAASVFVFFSFVALSVFDFIWVEKAANRLEREGRDVPR